MKFQLILILVLIVSCTTNVTSQFSNKDANQDNTDLKTDTIVATSINNTIYSDTLPIGQKFNVDNVKLAEKPLSEYPIKDVIENRLGVKLLYSPYAESTDSVVPIYGNGLFKTVEMAYDQHRPLVLSPDVIWLAICQGVSIHMNENFDSLQPLFFKSKDPVKLKFRNDNLENEDEAWASLIDQFSVATKQHVNKNYSDFFIANYSTTSAIETTAYRVTMLEAFKQAFVYMGESGCGIPSVTLKGTTEDWQAIYDRLDQLSDFGLSEWEHELKQVIKEFIAASNNQPNITFWQDIYKNAEQYGPVSISGWIIKFYPYLKGNGKVEFNEKTYESKAAIVYKKNKFLKGTDYLMSTIDGSDIPSGIATIEIDWMNHFKNERKVVEVKAGIMSMKQYDDLSIEPIISWAVVDPKENAKEYKFDINRFNDVAHQPRWWAPNVIKDPKVKAKYYHGKVGINDSTYEKLRTDLLSILDASCLSRLHSKYVDLELEFIVLSDGSIKDLKVNKCDDMDLMERISNAFNYLPGKWNAAKDEPNNILMLIDQEVDNVLMDVNSLVKIKLIQFE